jgi:hypothetical protein
VSVEDGEDDKDGVGDGGEGIFTAGGGGRSRRSSVGNASIRSEAFL